MSRPGGFGRAHLVLAVLLVAAVIASTSIGAYSFTPARLVRLLGEAAGWLPRDPADALDRNVLMQLRLPRVVLAGLTGAVLAVCGTVMQGLFRNPIVEPGLVGTSSGAALGAACVFVLGVPASAAGLTPALFALPLGAFVGGLVATLLTFRIASAFGRVNVFALLLAGIAVNALCNAGTGVLSYVARDPQARNIVFWNLGTFTSANWSSVALVAAAFALGFAGIAGEARALNALMLGEDEAASLGVDPAKLARRLLALNTLMVAVATSFVGVIAFVGLVVPHVLRLVRSSNHQFLIPASALLGAAFAEVVDLSARLVVPPAELPVGILTAAVGAPVFLLILVNASRLERGARG